MFRVDWEERKSNPRRGMKKVENAARGSFMGLKPQA